MSGSDWAPFDAQEVQVYMERRRRCRNDPFLSKTGISPQALHWIGFGITENNKKVWFTAEGYIAVGEAISKGHIRTLNFKPHAAAQAAYDLLNDELFVPSSLMMTEAGRAAIVHEMTHIIVDLSPATGWTLITNECAAYIAQAIYHKVTQTPIPDGSYTDPSDGTRKIDSGYAEIHAAARALVDSFGFGANTLGYGGITLADPELVRLRNAVKAVYGLEWRGDPLIPHDVFGLKSGRKINLDQ